jgi:hypothetical protein
VCREHLFYGETLPYGCVLGDECRFLHVRHEGDRLALVDMFSDWIAVKQHEQAAQVRGSDGGRRGAAGGGERRAGVVSRHWDAAN